MPDNAEKDDAMPHTPYKLALITGATSGIGEAFARLLPPTCSLVLVGRNAERLAILQKELAHTGRTITTLAADLATDAGLQAVIRTVQSLPIDLFINNAGLGFYGEMAHMSPASEETMLRLNVLAVGLLTRAVVPSLITQGQKGGPAGLIITSSAVAYMPMPGFATYAASKAYNLHIASALAEELHPFGVAVLGLCPGATATAFQRRAGLSGASLPFATSAEDVARGALQALGRKKTYIHGWPNYLMCMACKFLPRPLVTWAAGAVLKRSRPTHRQALP